MGKDIDWNEVSEDIVRSKLKRVDSVYIDLAMIKDIRIMAYILLNLAKDRYVKIMDEIKGYNARYDHEVVKHFSLKDYTEEDIDNYINDKTNHPLLSAAPETSVVTFVTRTIDEIIKHNRVCETTENNITVYLNMKNIQLTDEVKEYYKVIFKHQHATNLIFLSVPFNEIEEKLLRSIDFFFLDDIPTYLEVESKYMEQYDDVEDYPDPEEMDNLFAKLFYKLVFQRKHVVSSMQILDRDPNMDVEDIFKKTKVILDMFTSFSYIEKLLI